MTRLVSCHCSRSCATGDGLTVRYGMLTCVPVDLQNHTTRPLTPDTWEDFATLVEANNGVWGGCWCMGFHPEAVGSGTMTVYQRLRYVAV